MLASRSINANGLAGWKDLPAHPTTLREQVGWVERKSIKECMKQLILKFIRKPKIIKSQVKPNTFSHR